MKGRIGNILRSFLLISSFTYTSFDSIAQFYVGGKLCVGTSAPINPPMGTTPTTNTDCSEPTIFFDENKASTAWAWDFGDPTTVSDVASVRNPKYFYSQPGQYTVTLTRTIAGIIQSPETRLITIGTPPDKPLFFGKPKADTTICDGKTLKLDPYRLKPSPPGATFLWFPKGQTTQTIDVDSTGCYSVEVFDASGGCSLIAQINVKFCMQEANSGGTEKWYFGDGATLDFQAVTTPATPRDPLDPTGDLFKKPEESSPIFVPKPATQSNPIRSPEGAAMVYDPSGSLLFYTDGIDIYDKDDAPLIAMPPLTNSKLGGTNTSTQSSVIIPKGSCNECPHHLYYVYTINELTGLLSYSVIDVRRNGGKGAVVEKNVPVNLQTTQRVAAIKNANENAFFVYSHDAGTKTFRILKIDSTGTKEFTQDLGLVHSDAKSQEGYMRFSATGTKMAIAVTLNGKNYVEIYEVDKETGRLGAPLTIDIGVAAPPIIYGLEFSDDEEKLYITLRGDPTKGETSYLYQLNLNLKKPDEIAKQKKKIDESKSFAFGALQSGPVNGPGVKFIYMAINGSQFIPYIQNPNEIGGAALVGYQPISNGFGADLLGNSGLGFPNITQAKQKQDGAGLSAKYTGNCQNQPTEFETEGVCSPMKGEAVWDFGDGETGTGLKTSHTYTKTGTYKVKLTLTVYSETEASKIASQAQILDKLLGNTLKEKCKDFVLTDEIYIKPTPVVNLPDEAFVCVIENQKILLDPKPQQTYFPTYLWNYKSQTTPTIIADAIGKVTLKVTNVFENKSTCATSDKIEIKEGCEPRLFMPEIFTANKDGINDILQIPYAHITDFDLRIYNRWGEIIFESDDPERIWDGSYNGKVIAPMMYAFMVSYKSRDFPEREKITRRGGIFLVN